MSYEIPTIDQWMYETLSGDATLLGLLAVDNKPNGYQQGIYNNTAPQIDPISRKAVQAPYIVFSVDSQATMERSLCNGRFLTNTAYRVTVWDTASGAISMTRAQNIMARVDALLDGQTVTTTTPALFSTRDISGQSFVLSEGGRTDVAVTATYIIQSVE
jgi:hypothetical protein